MLVLISWSTARVCVRACACHESLSIVRPWSVELCHGGCLGVLAEAGLAVGVKV